MPVIEEVTRTSEQQDAKMIVEAGLNFFTFESDLLGEQLRRTKHLPEQLIDRYIVEALKRTEPKKLEDGSWFAEIPGFDGVWASDEDLSACAAELREVLLDWLILKIEHDDRDIPVIAGIQLNII